MILGMTFLGLEWSQPYWLLLILILSFLFWRSIKAKQDTATLSLPEVGHMEMGFSLKKLIYKYAAWLPFLGLLNLTIAMARPQKILHHQEFKGEGIEIMLAMDVSPSMLSLDFDPNRLEVAKELAIEFVKGRQGDRIGLTVFSGEAYTKCPITTDYQTLTKLIKELSPDNLEMGTAIGMGLATSVNQLKDSKAKSKIVVLLTDGSNNRGDINPMEAGELAKAFGIKVYTIGMGTEGIVNMPVRQKRNGQFLFAPVTSDFDEALLVQLAKQTSGKYFRAHTKEELKLIYKHINQLERSKIDVITHLTKIERFRPFLLIGLGFFVFYWVLMLGWVKPLP